MTRQLADLLLMIYDRGPISRTELGAELNLSPSCVSTVVRELECRGLVVSSGLAESSGGRRRVLLQINPELGHIIGIDIGSYMMRMVITDMLGTPVLSESHRSDQYASGVVDELLRQVSRLLKLAPRIDGIGISQSGQIDPDRNVVSFPRFSGWTEIPLQQVLQDRFGLPVLIDDSARAGGIAEQRFGQGKGVGHVFYVSVGMGIGAAIFTDGQLYRGQSGLAGELGHITINEEGALCYCGNRGCLEMYAGGKAIIDSVRSGVQQGVASTLWRNAPEELTYEAIVAAAEQDDRLAGNAISQAGLHLGTALADIVNLLNPKRIVLGGRLPQLAGKFLTEPLLRTLHERAFPRSLRALEVVVSSLGDDTPARGAATLMARELLKRGALESLASRLDLNTGDGLSDRERVD